MLKQPNRRHFLVTAATTGASLGLLGRTPLLAVEPAVKEASASKMQVAAAPLFKISVAEYSLHRMIERKELDPRDFGPFCKEKFGVDAVDYWMGPYNDKAKDRAYMDEMHKKSTDAGVKGLLIMVDIPHGQGILGNPDTAKRKQAVEAHYEWVEAAKRMDCHSIRVNASSKGTREEQSKLAADGLRQLSEFAAPHKINVIVENHGGLSSDGAWLSGVIKRVDLPNCGTLPDFGNFAFKGRENLDPSNWYDRYKGTAELMPFAKSVSAKSHGFDDEGNEKTIDYRKMLKIVVDANYHGYIGIEWEGKGISEVEGVLQTKRLLERVRRELSEA